MKHALGILFLWFCTPAIFGQPLGSTLKKVSDAPVRSGAARTTAVEICDNHIDDDLNGLTDENDFSCYYAAYDPSTCKASSIVWGCEGNGGIYWGDLSTGQTHLAAQLPIGFLDIAWASNGKLYAIGGVPSGLWEIDPATMTPQFIGGIFSGYGLGNSMAADGEGNLYLIGYTNKTEVIRLNIATWQACSIADLGATGVGPAGDLTFHNGNLYLTGSDNELARIDVHSGAVTTRPFINVKKTSYFGLVSCGDGYLYVAELGKVFQVDPATLTVSTTPSLTFSLDDNFYIYGLAAYPEMCQATKCPAKADITYNAGQPLCMTTGIQLQGAACGMNAPRFVWTTPQNTTIEANTITALQPGKYYLGYKTHMETCDKMDSFELKYPDKPILKIDTTYLLPGACACNGKMAVAVSCGSGNYSYEWSTGAATSAVTGICKGNYSVTITDLGSSTDTVIYFKLPAATKEIDNADIVADHDHCDQSMGSLTIASVSGGLAPYSYSLNGQPFVTTTNFPHLPEGDYLVAIKDNGGCSFQKQVRIENIGGPENINWKKTDALCGASAGSIMIESVNGGASPYTFSVDNGAYSSQTTITGIQPGSRVVHVKDNFGCMFDEPFHIDQTEALRIMVTPKDSTLCASEKITLHATVLSNSPDVTFNWGNNDRVSSNVFQTVIYENTLLVVQAVDGRGCTAVDSVRINATYCDSLFAKCILFANAFSPNKDGINETFGASRGSCEIRSFKLAIHNRWGQIVYQTNNASGRWDGTIHGNLQPAGTYLYNCSWIDAARRERHLKGTIILIR